ncbi:ribosomal protein S18-alanine N-acetyltransferase [Hahella chejuensis]|nr:ribosomal protein S18-alanine N-acetyltransferase [Hahella chejuensis]
MIDQKSGLAFRLMTEADLPLVLINERGAYSHPWTEGVFKECLTGVSECWVAMYKDELVGHAVTSMVIDEAHLLNLCVARDLQGNGMGLSFMAFLLERFRTQNMAELFLEVRASNTAAVHLYRKLGFNEIGYRKAYYPSSDGREDAIVMSMKLGREE